MVLRQAPPSSGTAPAQAGRNGPACCLDMGLLHKRHKGQGRRAGAGALVRADAPIRQEAGLGVAFRPVVGLFCAIWPRSEEHTSELQSLMRISYAVFCLKKKTRASN